MRPALTGWFAEFEGLEQGATGSVAYGAGAAAFAGATYDPTAHYRAAAVFDFHAAHRLTAERLREMSRRQVGLLMSTFERLDLDPAAARVEPMPPERRAGFLAVRTTSARRIAREARTQGLFVDARGGILRLGPAPYLRDDQLQDAVAIVGTLLGRS